MRCEMFKGKEYVYEVYKEKSFSRAAQNLYISQPALSATIKKIETRLGCSIFDRSSTPLRLTPAGIEYIKAVEKIIDMGTMRCQFLVQPGCFGSHINQPFQGQINFHARIHGGHGIFRFGAAGRQNRQFADIA